MAFNAQTYALSRKYTDESIEGTSGVIAGKNCQILSNEEIEKDGVRGHRITFAWYRDGETVARTDTIEVMNGIQGEQGEQGEKGDPGDTPEITVYEQSANTYILQIKVGDTVFRTPNLKGSGSGVDVQVVNDALVFTY